MATWIWLQKSRNIYCTIRNIQVVTKQNSNCRYRQNFQAGLEWEADTSDIIPDGYRESECRLIDRKSRLHVSLE